MARYKYLGESEADVPDLAGSVTSREHDGGPIQPGEEFETDVELNNPIFELIGGARAPEPAPPPEPEAEPEPVAEPAPVAEPEPEPANPSPAAEEAE